MLKVVVKNRIKIPSLPVENVKANVAFFNSFEPFVDIIFPYCQAIYYGAILMLKK